ncbi:hypothetical protein GCM10009085_49220 [Pseudomonas avellanae]|nr:hypothetical protein GCM10009085_49220 [Pseudomonas avellanae]
MCDAKRHKEDAERLELHAEAERRHDNQLDLRMTMSAGVCGTRGVWADRLPCERVGMRANAGVQQPFKTARGIQTSNVRPYLDA